MDDAERLELGRITAAHPCSERWSSMTGEACARRCGRCGSTVYDLSTLTAHEAREMVRTNEGQVRARFYTRGDGTMLTRDCPVGVAKARRRRLLGGLVVAVSAAAVLVAVAPSVRTWSSAAPAVQPVPSAPPPVQPVVAPAPPVATPPEPDETWMEQRRGRLELEHPFMRRHQYIKVIRGPAP